MSRISSLFLVYCSIPVASLSFTRMRLSSDRKHLSIHDLDARLWKNSSCVLGMTISDSEIFLMAESSIWWVVVSDSTKTFLYDILLFLFPRAIVFFGSTLNAVADSSSPWNTKAFVTPCTNPFLRIS